MPSLAEIVRTVDSVTSVVSLGGRTLLSLDTNPVPADWSHITKIDPEPEKRLPLAYPLYLSHTSAVSIGGSTGVTGDAAEETFDLVNASEVPAFHEPSAAQHVTDGTRKEATFLAVPEVLNGDNRALVGTLGAGIEHVKNELAATLLEEKLPMNPGPAIESRLSNMVAAWMMHDAVFEAYIIMNLDSAAAREANVTESDLLSPKEAKQRALAAEYHLESEVIYLEYSGTFGGTEAETILEEIGAEISWPRLWYGGGLDDRENARAMLDAGADAVVVGDIFHDVAREEARLSDQAREQFEGVPDRAEVETWLEGTIRGEESAAARYLSTIIDVPDPTSRGVRFLAVGIRTALTLDGIAARLEDPDRATLQRTLASETDRLAADFADILPKENATAVARYVGLAVLGERFDVPIEDGFAQQHFAVRLS